MTSRAAPTNVISTVSAFGQRFSRKQDYQAFGILRHARRLPAPAAALIQKIGKSVFVFTCSSRQFDYYGLILFHWRGFVSLSLAAAADSDRPGKEFWLEETEE